MEPNKDYDQNLNNSESQNEESTNNESSMAESFDNTNDDELEGTEEGYNSSDPDKYLAMEQPGVSYTPENDFSTSDNVESGTAEGSDLWDAEEKNSRNSEAFNQDEYMLDQNLDLDEETGQSISSDDI
jgi:hypothetical protein